MHALNEGKLCGNSIVYKMGFPTQTRDFIVKSDFVLGINMNVGPNLTFSCFLNMYFNESVPLKLGEGGENQNKKPRPGLGVF